MLLFALISCCFNLLFGQNDCPIENWIKENYTKEAKLMARTEMMYRKDNPYRNRTNVPQSLVNKYLSYLSAVYKQNDTVFTKYKVQDGSDAYNYLYRHTALSIELDTSFEWVKEFYRSGKLSGNKKFDNLLRKYNLKPDWGGRLLSDAIYNVFALSNEFLKIGGVKFCSSGSILEYGDSEPRLYYNLDEQVIKMIHREFRVEGDHPVMDETLWIYKIDNCAANGECRPPFRPFRGVIWRPQPDTLDLPRGK